MWRRILALTVKEFLTLLKDKRSRVVIVVPPLIQLMVFGYAATFDLKHVPFAVFSEDRGAEARELLAAFRGSPSFVEVARLAQDRDIAPLIDAKLALMVIRIGPRFSADLRAGRAAPLQLIVDGRNSNTAQLAVNYAQQIVKGFNTEWIARHGGSRPPAQIEMRAWFNPNLESRWFFIPGIVGVLTLLVTMLVTALSVAREREQGTFDQLLVTPLRPAEILLGKALPSFVIGSAEATLIILVAVFWFKVPFLGSPLTLYTGLALFLLSAIGLGLMISSLAVTQQQGLLGAFFFLVPAILLSGFATPIENMPPLVQDLTLLNPMRYFLVILRGVFLEGTPFGLLLHEYLAMAAIGAVALAIAAWLFRHRMY
ncbi:MAG: ABC transporter permease [Burkholderiales bacterium]